MVQHLLISTHIRGQHNITMLIRVTCVRACLPACLKVTWGCCCDRPTRPLAPPACLPGRVIERACAHIRLRVSCKMRLTLRTTSSLHTHTRAQICVHTHTHIAEQGRQREEQSGRSGLQQLDLDTVQPPLLSPPGAPPWRDGDGGQGDRDVFTLCVCMYTLVCALLLARPAAAAARPSTGRLVIIAKWIFVTLGCTTIRAPDYTREQSAQWGWTVCVNTYTHTDISHNPNISIHP
jgi:hypothetical protein